MEKDIRAVGHKVIGRHRDVHIAVGGVVKDDVVTEMEVARRIRIDGDPYGLLPRFLMFEDADVHGGTRNARLAVHVAIHHRATVVSAVNCDGSRLYVVVVFIVHEDRHGVAENVVVRHRHVHHHIAVGDIEDDDVVTDTEVAARNLIERIA